MTPKSNSRAIKVHIFSKLSDSLRDSLATEPFDATSTENLLTCSINANSTVDIRARWNTMMRSLIGSHEALLTGNQLDKDEW
ncbi:MAG: hypothetical protein VX514_03755 [Candidatus Thermoplasmatota archaeon]|nr:hypothetical protein [Candidatus Thermoplasmatota archaeon]MEC7462075.1 hypothetical protein [Candidatus Thermoplasmatota archaeon]MEC7688136.1 hypothetical protein [Candidatus Thermoplasmatota archaeon]MEC8385007.1 hypothetical protein [Candidatus Thermoplasmatota archaeon]MED5376159.1 hypothetical protein [Candidatus Thermoplasmatota archaeon]